MFESIISIGFWREQERRANYLKNYKTDQQLKEENLQRWEKDYSGRIKAIAKEGEQVVQEVNVPGIYYKATVRKLNDDEK